ncbi:RNA polymerase subunit sigma-70 [Dactylosporangium roseum]|uniref:RNA polymerase subunit sigma-70 n=1 Tax=Dactylosporangium roseum TaxID=47989 RepID=UPI0021B4D0D8|nr:RNA polymerase subunit sigma-70 [Dactylosporangium roseum]
MESEELLAAARDGDGDAFAMLVAPHRQALHVHCYRMLGSLDDADDALQEALVRAWRSLGTFEGRAPLRHWLYRITTTTCLKAIGARGRTPQPAGEPAWLQPYPDRHLDRLDPAAGDPALLAEQRDSVTLAFVVALQRLPASQRAVLLLREVLSFTAAETGALLDLTVPAVNSALQRARVTLGTVPTAAVPFGPAEKQAAERFVDAWQRRDIAALAALLRADVILSMPPELLTFTGGDALTEFFATVPAEGRLELIDLVTVRANGQPALAAYLPDSTGTCCGYGIMVLTVDPGGAIAQITAFPLPGVFAAFGLPAHR